MNTVSQLQQLKSVGSLPVSNSQLPTAVSTPSAVFSGVPKVVSNPRVYTAAGSASTQRNITVTFLGNAEDKNFSHCKIWFKNYKGRSNPVLMTAAPGSPTTFTADATGETVVVIFQSVGSKGEVPLTSCPTSIITLS
jgi:hypothetical protein